MRIHHNKPKGSRGVLVANVLVQVLLLCSCSLLFFRTHFSVITDEMLRDGGKNNSLERKKKNFFFVQKKPFNP